MNASAVCITPGCSADEIFADDWTCRIEITKPYSSGPPLIIEGQPELMGLTPKQWARTFYRGRGETVRIIGRRRPRYQRGYRLVINPEMEKQPKLNS